MNFSEALNSIKSGLVVRRHSWNSNHHVTLSEGKSSHFVFIGSGREGRCLKKITLTNDYLIKVAEEDSVIGWTPTTNDLLAEDWEIIPVEKKELI